MPDAPAPWQLFVQPDQRSCGAAAMVAARFLGDPDYRKLLEGGSLTSPRTLAGDTALRERFKTETLAMHQRITGLADVSGKPQIPWHRKFGTPPWAVARQLSGTVRADGTRATYSWHVARTSLPGAYQRLLDASQAGRVSAIYVGTTWVPRHVALVVEATARGTLNVYDPARGRLDELDRLAFLGNRVDIAGWDVAWFVVTPES
jgi:hypothetical protein